MVLAYNIARATIPPAYTASDGGAHTSLHHGGAQESWDPIGHRAARGLLEQPTNTIFEPCNVGIPRHRCARTFKPVHRRAS
jgi:hypothetical protein